MNIVYFVLGLSISLALVCLFVRLAEQRKLILQFLKEQRRGVETLGRGQVTDFSDFIQSQRGPIITIEILDAVEVAAQSSMIGVLIGRFAPDTIQRLVVRRTADTMRSLLTDHVVEAQVRVHEPGEQMNEIS